MCMCIILFRLYIGPGTRPLRSTLKTNAMPSKFAWTPTQSEAVLGQDMTSLAGYSDVQPNDFDVNVQEEVVMETEDVIIMHDIVVDEAVTCATQTDPLPKTGMCIDKIKHDDSAILQYTGLENYTKFNYVLLTLGPNAYELNYRWRQTEILSIENQFLVTMMKLRKHYTNKDLSLMFEVSEFTISNVFVTWINFMYCQWKELDLWPSKDLVAFFSPLDFNKQFPNCRIIIDGTEVPIKKPKNPNAQQKTWSSYKNRNTLKTMVGCTPGGLITHIQDAYGGSASDRILTERSNLMNKLDPGDSIMSDKGFTVQDMFAPYDISVNIPTFMTGKNQLSVKALSRDRKIATKRVLIERIIGLAKTYKILCSPLNDIETALGSQIIFSCFMLCNFR